MAKQKAVVKGNKQDENQTRCCCNCKRKLDPYQLFEDNVDDVAKSLAQIMVICGISTTKACNAKSIIKRAFIYHEKVRTRCPNTPPIGTHLHRDDMLQALRLKCEMESVEAMLTYAIIKRAFKAFFHGKKDRTISNPIVDAMAIHSQRPAWLHAAYRTARIFDNYRASFFWAHKSYEKQINIIYRSLYERMSSRANPLTVSTCSCRNCENMEVPGHTKPGAPPKQHEKLTLADCSDLPMACIVCGLQVPKIERNVKLKYPRPILNHELTLPRCNKCNSPMLICECNVDELTGELFGECGQDSYKVKWYRIKSEKDVDRVPRKGRPEGANGTDSSIDNSVTSYEDIQETESDWVNHHCPIDCKRNTSSEFSDVCHESRESSLSADMSSSSFTTCSDGQSEDPVDKLEKYLNQLWAEEVAAKKNPDTYVPRNVLPPRQPCEPCKRD